MSSFVHNDATHPYPNPRPIIGGVCASIAMASHLPVWVIRAAALLLAVELPIIALILYLALSIGLHRRRRRLLRRWSGLPNRLNRQNTPRPNPFSTLIDHLASRFATLDQRLARLERRSGP